ncbi:unnamed protein product [Porites evermanni]|uniref:SCP domain-containing protein n=1 Tax=Porites evermanni TaxID=104178 RepID=A0ABN8LPJ9_9CNID|nr:unnamed protein product [Porites evermanni]
MEVCDPGYTFGQATGSPGAGHFSQVVWKESTKLGIGMAETDENGMKCTYIVGRYKPAGNYGGEYAENVPQGHTVSNEHKVFKALKELDRAKAWDVTGFTQSKSHCVTCLFNESFRTGQFSFLWKIAKSIVTIMCLSVLPCIPNSWSPLLTLTYEIWHTRETLLLSFGISVLESRKGQSWVQLRSIFTQTTYPKHVTILMLGYLHMIPRFI